MELRIRPKSNYLHMANWEELYLLTEHWKSDIEFFEGELRFLRTLVDKYFIWLIKDENIGAVQSIANQLAKADQKTIDITAKINKHLVHIEDLIQNAFSHDDEEFRNEHLELENQFAEFVKSFRKTKSQTFAITEHVIEEEKLKHLLAI